MSVLLSHMPHRNLRGSLPSSSVSLYCRHISLSLPLLLSIQQQLRMFLKTCPYSPVRREPQVAATLKACWRHAAWAFPLSYGLSPASFKISKKNDGSMFADVSRSIIGCQGCKPIDHWIRFSAEALRRQISDVQIKFCVCFCVRFSSSGANMFIVTDTGCLNLSD